jgi:hypothetical protein
MTVLVTGGRVYTDAATVYRVLDELHENGGVDLVVQGWADGADKWARDWAYSRSVPCLSHAADWNRQGRALGLEHPLHQ